MPIDFILFGLTLLAIAVFHRHTLPIALAGLACIAGYKLAFAGFAEGPGFPGLLHHLEHEWVVLADLLGLLLGFAILAQQFDRSNAPRLLLRLLPSDWRGGFLLLMVVFAMSSLLDNIAGAMIGGTIARGLYRDRVHVGYIVGIVAASNAGGAGSVVGDTTTTMMWIHGVSPLQLLPAYLPALVAVAICSFVAARQQHAHAAIESAGTAPVAVDAVRLGIVTGMLASAIGANVAVKLWWPDAAHAFPFIGAALWVAILATAPVRRHAWETLPHAGKEAAFLLALVAAASMMPIDRLPDPSWQTALGLGFVSAVFDNIPLTALALRQGGYDWALLAYAVGFGGSMLWFGSTAGVALGSAFPEAKSAVNWLRYGWHVPLAYVAGFFALLGVSGWHPA
jgi:Na+/H+ antiporter NhaD/arsenite permease-like protein